MELTDTQSPDGTCITSRTTTFVTFLGQGAHASRLRGKIVSSGSSTLGTGSNQLPSLLKPSLDYAQSAHVSSVTVYGSTGYSPDGLLYVLFCSRGIVLLAWPGADNI